MNRVTIRQTIFPCLGTEPRQLLPQSHFARWTFGIPFLDIRFCGCLLPGQTMRILAQLLVDLALVKFRLTLLPRTEDSVGEYELVTIDSRLYTLDRQHDCTT